VLVFGEQHDQVDQQRQVADAVATLAARGQLRAVVLEMADRGVDTRALPRGADDAAARDALAWQQERGWPWVQYGPVVMAAVRAGVPVWGGNLPRAEMRAAMANTSLDAAVTPEIADKLTAAIRDGHCGLLSEEMAPGMRRIQIARDRSMAGVVRDRLAEGQGGVVLLTGAQHASRDRGVPWQLVKPDVVSATAIRVVLFEPGSDGLVADERRVAAVTQTPDQCEALKAKMGAPEVALMSVTPADAGAHSSTGAASGGGSRRSPG